MEAEDILREYYGYESFRPGQDRMVQAILSGRDAMGIMPTGAGKSICFQVPAMLLPGVTISILGNIVSCVAFSNFAVIVTSFAGIVAGISESQPTK